MTKKICFTLDLEQDYGRIEEYAAFKNIKQLIDLFNKYNLKLTIFTAGKIIEERPEIIRLFNNNLDAEFHLHSYSHEVNKRLPLEERKKELEKAIIAYQNYFKERPRGYRAPCGDLDKKEINWLKDGGFLFSSSFIPTYRPGCFNNLRAGSESFYYPNGLLEIPFSVLSVKIPYSLSYFQLLGWPLSKLLIKTSKTPPTLIFGFHLHNLSRLENLPKLKPSFKLFYSRNQNKGFHILENFIKMTLNNGYQSAKISEFYENTSY